MMSNKEFLEAQLQDNCFALVIKWLQAGRRPPQEKVGSTRSETRYYWSRFDKLKYLNNIAYIETTNEDDTQQQLRALVPQQLRNEIMQSTYNAPVVGHFGIQ